MSDDNNYVHDGDFGVYFRNKISKLQGQNGQNVLESTVNLKSNIFSGCFIFVNGYTQPPRQEIGRLVFEHGGLFHSYHIDRTTHFVCDYLPRAKVLPLMSKDKSTLFYVTTNWLLESIKHKKRLPECEFLPNGLGSKYGQSINNLFSEVLPSKPISEASCHDVDLGQPLTVADVDMKEQGDDKPVAEMASSDILSSSLVKSQLPKMMSPATKAKRLAASTDDDPNFIQHYYSSSRLHFIGSWRARLPQLIEKFKRITKSSNIDFTSSSSITAAAMSSESVAKGSMTAAPTSERVVLHVDMDCFFVTALIRDRPHLKKFALAVAHSSTGGTSEISSCNYIARASGVRNGMFMANALMLCPQLQVLTYNFPLYEKISEQLYKICFSSAPIVEPVSVDEVYLEYPVGTDPLQKARELRQQILLETGCEASVGAGPNKLIARIATKKAKPNGQVYISTNNIKNIMAELPVADLPGVGWATQRIFNEKNIHICTELWPYSLLVLQEWFGDITGNNIWKSCRGIDDHILQLPTPRKSVGAEVNWGLRFHEQSGVELFLKQLSEEVFKRCREAGVHGRTVTLKLKKRTAGEDIEPSKFLGCGRCDNISKSYTFTNIISSSDMISIKVLNLFQSLCNGTTPNIPVSDLRGMGISISKCEPIGSSSERLASGKSRSKLDATRQLPLAEFQGWGTSDISSSRANGSSNSNTSPVDYDKSMNRDIAESAANFTNAEAFLRDMGDSSDNAYESEDGLDLRQLPANARGKRFREDQPFSPSSYSTSKYPRGGLTMRERGSDLVQGDRQYLSCENDSILGALTVESSSSSRLFHDILVTKEKLKLWQTRLKAWRARPTEKDPAAETLPQSSSHHSSHASFLQDSDGSTAQRLLPNYQTLCSNISKVDNSDSVIAPPLHSTLPLASSLSPIASIGSIAISWGEESLSDIRKALIHWRSVIGSKVTKSHTNLLVEYGLWLLRSNQADRVAAFIRLIRAELLRYSTEMESSNCNDLLNKTMNSSNIKQSDQTWRNLVLEVEDRIQFAAFNLFGATLRID